MKKNDLFLLMSEIDPQYVSEAENATQRSTKKSENHLRIAWQKWGALAASCLIVLLCAVPVAKRLMNGVTPGVIPPDTAPGTDVVENPDFIIENGVLLNYVGDDPNVVIPDEVIEISRDAFAEKGDIIDTITIGKNVEVVDYLFLSHVDHLSGVVVEEENPKFEIYEGVFIDKDNSVFIQTSDNYKIDFLKFLETVRLFDDGNISLGAGEEAKLVFGRASATIYQIEYNFNGETQLLSYVREISYRGNELNLDERFIPSSNFCFFQNDEMLLYAGELVYVLTENNILPLGYYDVRPSKDPNTPYYRYYQSQDGVIRYVMKPIKYPTPGYNIFSIEDYSYPLRATTGLDDFFKEEGYLSVDAGELLYIPTATYTMETGGELDDYIAAFEQYRNEGDPFYGKFNSIEELFAYNKENQE